MHCMYIATVVWHQDHNSVTTTSQSPNPHRQSGLQGHGFVMVTIVNALCRSNLADLMKRVRGTQGSFILKFSWSYEKRDITLGEDGGRGSFDLTPGNCHDLPSESSLRWAFVKNGKLCWNCENIPLPLSSTYMTENENKTHYQFQWRHCAIYFRFQGICSVLFRSKAWKHRNGFLNIT